MKVADGPVTLEVVRVESDHGSPRSYLRWRDYHKSYPSKQRVCYVHQLSAIADGADPYKVFSGGAYQVHHEDNIEENNARENLSVECHADHWDHHVNGHDDGDNGAGGEREAAEE